MIGHLVINNLKLMLRNKWIVITMLAGPVVVIALLSSAFEDLMAVYEDVEEFTVGYQISAGSVFYDGMEQIKEAGEETGIILCNYPEGDPEDLMKQNNLAAFLALEDGEYTIYKSADYKIQGETLEGFMETVKQEISNEVRKSMVLAGKNAVLPSEGIKLPVKELAFMPAIDSKNYYGIIETVYFIWCGIVSLGAVLASEKKNRIAERFQVSGISETRLYFGKWVPAVLATAVGTAATVFLTMAFFGISWGTNPLTAVVLMLTVMGAMAFGMLLYAVFDHLAVMVVAAFTIVWFMGFFGGSFETYMFSGIPEFLKNLSPIYHVNRALVEYSCMGKSGYAMSSILYMGGITIFCSILAVLINKMRKRGKA